MKRGVALLRPTQTRARASACAPHPAAGRSGGGRWNGDGTVHNGAASARRRRSPACGGRHPYEPDVPSRQGGQQSGAAGERAPAGRVSTGEPLHNEEGRPKPTDRQAEVAMGAMDSFTAGPDRAAARLTDVRSLAAPVPSGTSIPTARQVVTRTRRRARPSLRPPKGPPRRGRKTQVYALRQRLRRFFNVRMNEALPMPEARRIQPPCRTGRVDRIGVRLTHRAHGKVDNQTSQATEVGRAGGNFLQARRTFPGSGEVRGHRPPVGTLRAATSPGEPGATKQR
jgi:hypothetical protein